MAVTTTELKKLQRQLEQLQKRVERLESDKGVEPAPMRQALRPLSSNREIIAYLKEAGVIRDLTEEEKKLAAEWQALPQTEKNEVNRALSAIRLDQTVADLILVSGDQRLLQAAQSEGLEIENPFSHARLDNPQV